MTIVEVNNSASRKEFLEFPVRLYKNEQNWIRPLDKDIEGVFDEKKNKKFRNGEACRWLLQDDSGKTIGKAAGDTVNLVLYYDPDPEELPQELLECLSDAPPALENFNSFTLEEQQAYITWIYNEKDPDKQVERIAEMVSRVQLGLKIRNIKEEKRK